MSADSERSVGAVIRDIGGNVDRIVRAELQVAIAELREMLQVAKQISVLVVLGVVSAIFSLGFLLLSGMFALAHLMPFWLAAMVIALVCGVAAAIILLAARASAAPKESAL